MGVVGWGHGAPCNLVCQSLASVVLSECTARTTAPRRCREAGGDSSARRRNRRISAKDELPNHTHHSVGAVADLALS